MIRTLVNWLNRNKIKAFTLNRKDKLTTGYVSELYVNGKYVCLALDTYGLNDKKITVKRTAIVTDEFDQPHIDNLLVLEPNNTLIGSLASVVDVDVDSNHMALEC